MGKKHYSHCSIWYFMKKGITSSGHISKTSFSHQVLFFFSKKSPLAELMKVGGTLNCVFMIDNQIGKKNRLDCIYGQGNPDNVLSYCVESKGQWKKKQISLYSKYW